MKKTFPLIRNRWSNEHFMALLFAVILLYMAPYWLLKPSDIPVFLIVFAFSLLMDAISGYIRHKRLICSVSAAVTAAVLHVLTPDIPLWGKLIGAFVAIILVKQIWGGTGKNVLNPAIAGCLFICVLFPVGFYPVTPSIFLIPAVVLSLPFSLFRPFASLGFIAGLIIAYMTRADGSWQVIAVNGIFAACIIMTDPVTVTPRKFSGFAGSLAVAFLSLMFGNTAISFSLILIFNLLSYIKDKYFFMVRLKRNKAAGASIKTPYKNIDIVRGIPFINLTDKKHDCGNGDIEPGRFEHEPCNILELITENGVYGMGGAAFPTAEKIKAVISSNAEDKYFIINAAECDPGLIHDKWLLLNRAKDIYKGIELISRCIDFKDIFIAVESSILPVIANRVGDIRVKEVGDFYPAGYEKTLIRSILKINIPVDFTPSKLGILVLNVQTLIAVYEAVYLNKRADDRYITAANLKTGEVSVVKAKTCERVINIAETIYPGEMPVFVGGGIMNAHMAGESEIIGTNTNYVAVSGMPRYKESPLCSNCGACIKYCPQGLNVKRMAELADKGDFAGARKLGVHTCINCGLCSYVCLAGKNLASRITEAGEKYR